LLRFKTVSYRDRACTVIEAFSLLVPDSWRFEGGIRWSADNVMMPATCGFKASGCGIEVQALPGHAFFWTSLPQVRLSHPVGSMYLGATVCPPVTAPEFISNIMLPALRGNASDLTIIKESPPVDMGSTLGFGATFKSCGVSESCGAGARVKYRQNAKEFEEELYCTVTSFKFALPAGGDLIDCVFWMADSLFSFRGEDGHLDGVKDILQTMMYSIRYNPQWLDKNNRIVLFLKDRQMNKPYSLRQLSIDVDGGAAQYGDGLKYFDQRQSAYRWIADSLCRNNSTDEYYDPIQQICVRLPAGYDDAWASDTGEYLLSNHSDLSADNRFTEIWKVMEPLRVKTTVDASPMAGNMEGPLYP